MNWLLERFGHLLGLKPDTGQGSRPAHREDDHVDRNPTPEPARGVPEISPGPPPAESIPPDDSLDEIKKWTGKLVNIASRLDVEPDFAHGQRGEYVHLSSARDESKRMFDELFRTINQLAGSFNDSAQRAGERSRVRLSIAATNDTRFRITSATRCLSVVLETGRIQAYILPASASYDLDQNETPDRLKLTFILTDTLSSQGARSAWVVCGLPLTGNDILFLSKALLRDLVILSSLDIVAGESGKKFEKADNIHRIGIARGFKDSLTLSSEIGRDLVQDLLVAQQNTIQKLLSQQEEIQASLGRDLHDSVLADVMMLSRRLSSPDEFDREQVLETLEELSKSIREICQGLVPRDLKDWGLETVLEDLVDKAGERTQADCTFSVEGKLPELPSSVELHIFRIVQEALNNVEKYAQARHVSVTLSVEGSVLSILVEDDGKGFDTRDIVATSTGGFGLPSLSERVEVIKAYYPAQLSIDSEPGKGTRIGLKLQLGSRLFESKPDF
ncbi:MAG: sensor histidine kinase [Cyanobacteria bacterium HKST-UBA02]|nr:sensor histidine kinase [Cyanobacteria bacterium HKST-UBA02]